MYQVQVSTQLYKLSVKASIVGKYYYAIGTRVSLGNLKSQRIMGHPLLCKI